jgi:hypothetical protein
MKSLIIGLTLLSSFSVFAGNNCESLTGSYKCNYQGQDYSLEVSVVGKNFSANIANEEMAATLDNQTRRSNTSDDDVRGRCSVKKQAIELETYFRGELTALVSFTKTASGLSYALVEEGNKSVMFQCAKIK